MITTLMAAMGRGQKVINGPQWMCKLKNGRYLLYCDTPGCCDSEMTYGEAEAYLTSDDANWTVVEAVKRGQA